MKNLTFIASAIALTACASSPTTANQNTTAIGWVALKNVDDFTDEKTCKVTWATTYSKSSYREVFKIYPVIVFSDSEPLKVGVESVSANASLQIDIPVGNVQLRIDDLPTHEVKAVDMEVLQASMASGNQATLMQEQMESIMSPRTVTEGDDAKAILTEMLSGTEIRYRQMTPGNSGKTGVFPLEGLSKKVAECGYPG
tara:strand:+ start:1550 stop:2143 length:594 start_codon:yes stop_codon:yes gene_type:complete